MCDGGELQVCDDDGDDDEKEEKEKKIIQYECEQLRNVSLAGS